MADQAPIVVDVISDVICPWCYVGKRRLEAAIQQVPDLAVEVRWHPYQLDATLPKDGTPRSAYLQAKFTDQQIATMYQALDEAGQQDGIDFAFDKIELTPNTMDAHRLILWSRADNLQNEMAEALFSAFFIEGKDLTRKDTLVEIARQVGMEHDLVEQLLDTDSDIEKIEKQINSSQKGKVSSVPFFIIDERFVINGAESAEALAAALRHTDETRTNAEIEQ